MVSNRKKSYTVVCEACTAKLKMPERLWNKRVAGRVTTVHCRKCSAPIRLDGRIDHPPNSNATEGSERPDIAKKISQGSERPEPTTPAATAVSTTPTKTAAPSEEVAQPEPAKASKPSPTPSPYTSTRPEPANAARTVSSVRPVSSRIPPVLAPARPAAPRPRALEVLSPPVPAVKPASVALPALPVKTLARSDAPVSPSEKNGAPTEAKVAPAKAKAEPAKTKVEPAKASVDDESEPAERSAIIEVEAPSKQIPPRAANPDRAAQQASDAESVPSLRALVVATPRVGHESEKEPEPEPEPLLSEPPSEPMLSGQRSVVPPNAAVEPEATSVAPSGGRGRLFKVGAWLGVAAAVVFYFSASEPRTRVDSLSHNAAPAAMATPLEDSAPAAVTPARNAPPPSEQVSAQKSEPELDAQAEPEPREANDASDTATPYDAQMLGFARRWARDQALACHQGGRAGGTVEVVVTFAPEGKVSEAVLHGEPIASAPVAGCIESYFKAMLIPPYEGQPFTIRETLTLR